MITKHISLIILCSTLTLSACQLQMVGVKQQNISTTLSNERDSILTQNKLSEASLNTLAKTSREAKKCIHEPTLCLQDIQQIPEIIDEDYLSVGSELFLAHANELKQSSQCNPKHNKVKIIQNHKKQQLQQQKQQDYQQCISQQLESLNQSIRYSYAYLFATQRMPQERLFDNRQVQVRDFYNQAIANMINLYNQNITHQQNINFLQPINIGQSTYSIDHSLYPDLDFQKIKKFISTYNLKFSGLRSISRRDGFGSEFVIEFDEPQHTAFKEYLTDPFISSKDFANHPNIHQVKYLPATIIIEPSKTNSIAEILSDKNFKIKLINPYLYQTIKIKQIDFPLAANFSAPYGLWLANTELASAAYFSLIDREQKMIMPHLYMAPYNPDKKIIIMIHGLASSPEAWIDMTNDIMGDNILRENYQVWQVFYSTNMPILESRYQIYALLKQNIDYYNTQYPQKPIKDIVLVGHSMGGVISRLLVSNNDFSPRVLDYLKTHNPKRYHKLQAFALASQRLKMQALPAVNRAIFISSPFKGTDFADRWFTLMARKIIKLPKSFLTTTLNNLNDMLDHDEDSMKELVNTLGKKVLQNGPSDLSNKSVFNLITEDTQIIPQVKYHSIIGNHTKSNDKNIITDGIVPYYSAHLDGAESEKIIHGGHSIQYTPEAVLELRRILRLHLNELHQQN